MKDLNYNFHPDKMLLICCLVLDRKDADGLSTEEWLEKNGYDITTMTDCQADMLIEELKDANSKNKA